MTLHDKEDRNNTPESDGQDEDFAAMLEQSFTRTAEIEVGQQVEGTIIHLTDDTAFVDLGGKSEGVIAIADIFDPDSGDSIKLGDRIKAFVIGKTGHELRLGKTMGQDTGSRASNMDQLLDAFHNRIPVEGSISATNKGGFEVQVMGHRAFLPVSQLELTRITETEAFVGRSYRFVITEMKEHGRNIVLSRTVLLREEMEARAAELRAKLTPGDIIEGTVKSLREFGAFIDLGGVEGLAHISELAWQHVKDPADVLQVGARVKVKVLKLEEGAKGGRISLSLRQAQEDPWISARRELQEGISYQGTVVRIAPFGAFVELLPGVDGLVHISEMSWTRRVNHPSEVVKEGEKILVTLQSVDWDKKRLSLTMKDTTGDPWSGVEEQFPVGTVVTGTVERIAPFGVFVQASPGLTGLIPNSELDNRRGTDVERQFPVGSQIDAEVITVSESDRRLTLSRKASRTRQESADFTEFKRKTKQPEPTEVRPTVTLGDLLRAKLDAKR